MESTICTTDRQRESNTKRWRVMDKETDSIKIERIGTR